MLEVFVGHIRPRSCLPLLLMPLTAIAVYAPVAAWGLTLPTNWVLYIITMPLGFCCLVRSLWAEHLDVPDRIEPELGRNPPLDHLQQRGGNLLRLRPSQAPTKRGSSESPANPEN
jgi:hypothetical protein